MYKLVVVEDEKDVRGRITNLIAKSGSKFEVVSEYENGIDAYEGILANNPDLILTDIKIPFINGIELSKKIREVLPLIKIIFLTGYNEFDYAKEAANIGVVGFICKPITSEDINGILRKTEAALDKEYLTSANLNQLSAFYENNLPVIRENDLNRLSNMSDVPAAFESKLRSNKVFLDYEYFMVCVFDFDSTIGGDNEGHDLIFSSIRESIGKDLDELCDYDLFNRYDKLCLILKYNNPPDISDLERRLDLVIQRSGRYSEMSVSAGVSEVYANNKNFAAMLKEAMRALSYRNVMDGGRVFFYENVGTSAAIHSVNDKIDNNMIKEIGYMIRFNSVEVCSERIDGIWKRFGSSEELSLYLATSILNVLIKACDDLESFYNLYGGLNNLYNRLLGFKTDIEMRDFLKELANNISRLNGDIIVDNVERHLQKILNYIETHCCDPNISFDSVANEVHFSISYISALLKKKRNTSFIKILTGLRMEKAKELLADQSMKITDVAERLGYNDSYYFSHCFKKHMGLSPKEYRKNEQRK